MNKLHEIVNNIFGIGNDTSAPILITLFVFIIGIIITYLINLVEKLLKRNSTRKLFIELLKEISETTLKQADIFKEFCEILRIDYEETFILERENINHLSNINKLSFEVIHESFFTGIENYIYFRHNREEFNRVWSGISNLTYWEEYYRSDLNRFNEEFKQYNNKRNEVLDLYNKNIISSLLDLKQTDDLNRIEKYKEKCLKIGEDYKKLKNRSHHYKTQIHLVEPLLKVNKEFIDISFCFGLVKLLEEMDFYYENIEHLLKVYKNLFMNYYKVYHKIGLAIKEYV